MRSKITLIIALAIVSFTSTISFAQLVTSDADDGTDGILRNDIAETAPGGTITVMLAVNSVTLTSEIGIDKGQTVAASAEPKVTIDTNSNGRVFNITAGTVTLNNLILTNGIAIDEGGI